MECAEILRVYVEAHTITAVVAGLFLYDSTCWLISKARNYLNRRAVVDV